MQTNTSSSGSQVNQMHTKVKQTVQPPQIVGGVNSSGVQSNISSSKESLTQQSAATANAKIVRVTSSATRLQQRNNESQQRKNSSK